jgi:hypothetical protein
VEGWILTMGGHWTRCPHFFVSLDIQLNSSNTKTEIIYHQYHQRRLEKPTTTCKHYSSTPPEQQR